MTLAAFSTRQLEDFASRQNTLVTLTTCSSAPLATLWPRTTKSADSVSNTSPCSTIRSCSRAGGRLTRNFIAVMLSDYVVEFSRLHGRKCRRQPFPHLLG